MTRPRLPRRRIVSRAERRAIRTDMAVYSFAVDVLSCGHEVHSRAGDPATTGCPHCPEGRPTGYFDPGGGLDPALVRKAQP